MHTMSFIKLTSSILVAALAVACSSAEPGGGSGTGGGASTSSGGGGSSSSSSSGGGSSSSSGGGGSSSSSSGGSSSGGASKKAPGELCINDGDCESQLCLFADVRNPQRGLCTMLCTNIAQCPGGYTRWSECGTAENVTGKVCIPKT